METRKVQLSGGTTYTVSLPKSWAQEHGVESGSIVSLHPNGDGSLLLDVIEDEGIENSTDSIDVTTTDTDTFTQQVLALYAVGCDSVALRDRNGHSPDRQQEIESAIDGLSGFEMLEVADKQIKLVNLVDAENIDIRKTALRLRLVALSMQRDSIAAIIDDDDELAKRVISRDNEADKLFWMVTRHFRRSLSNLRETKKLGYSREQIFEYYYICRQFERVADHAVKMVVLGVKKGVDIPVELVERLEELSEQSGTIIEDAADVVLGKADIRMAHEALSACEQLLSRIDTIERDLYDYAQSDAAYTTGLLLDSIRRSAKHGANVAEMGIQQGLRRKLE
jgi:phosphate uptake regulator